MADVFLDAWIKIAKFDHEKANFRTWLLILTEYKALTYRRNKHLSNVVEDVEIKDNINLEKQVILRQDQEQVMNVCFKNHREFSPIQTH